jgi:hypothetical protein
VNLRLQSALRDCARAVFTWPTVGWQRDYLYDYAEVSVHENHSGCWYVQGYLDFRANARSSWHVCRLFKSREDAAREAADVFAECVRIVHAYHGGHAVNAPTVAMIEAWEAGEGAELTARVHATIEERGGYEIDFADQDYRGRWASLLWRKAQAATAYQDARSEWLRANDWRPFRDFGEVVAAPVALVPAGQLSLLEVA